MPLLEALGNAADLPGSSIRDLLAGRNPLDQWMSPFSQDNRTSGQDLLHALGVSGDSPWLSFGTEMALDPMTYLGLGMIGKGAKAAGVGAKASKASNVLKAALSAPDKAAFAMRAAPKAAINAVKGLKPKSLADALNATLFNPNFRQMAGGAGLLHSTMLGREGNMPQEVY